MAEDAKHEIILSDDSMLAGADLSAKRGYIVKASAGTIVICGDGDLPHGVLFNAPASGERAVVVQLGRVPVSLNATLAKNAIIAPSSDGQALAATSADYCIGYLEVGGDADNKVTAVINCINPPLLA